MHMIHFEDAYVTSKGRIRFGQAYASPLGVAILSVFFHVDHTKPQVTLLFYHSPFVSIKSF